MRIIDRDLDFYTAMVEQHERNAQAAWVGQEARHAALKNAAQNVQHALELYRRMIDSKI